MDYRKHPNGCGHEQFMLGTNATEGKLATLVDPAPPNPAVAKLVRDGIVPAVTGGGGGGMDSKTQIAGAIAVLAALYMLR